MRTPAGEGITGRALANSCAIHTGEGERKAAVFGGAEEATSAEGSSDCSWCSCE